jgi:hypothetical protein
VDQGHLAFILLTKLRATDDVILTRGRRLQVSISCFSCVYYGQRNVSIEVNILHGVLVSSDYIKERVTLFFDVSPSYLVVVGVQSQDGFHGLKITIEHSCVRNIRPCLPTTLSAVRRSQVPTLASPNAMTVLGTRHTTH